MSWPLLATLDLSFFSLTTVQVGRDSVSSVFSPCTAPFIASPPKLASAYTMGSCRFLPDTYQFTYKMSTIQTDEDLLYMGIASVVLELQNKHSYLLLAYRSNTAVYCIEMQGCLSTDHEFCNKGITHLQRRYGFS